MKQNISIVDFVTDPQLLGLSISKPQETRSDRFMPIPYKIAAGHLAAVHGAGALPETRVQ